jgi:TolB-like protein/Tfp pilus assembly protein PilF/tRNA A-37 threonylcarbamoyl transferase component Bud32
MGRAETTNGRVCGKCGNTIFDTAPQGLCSVCLFDTGLSILTESVGGPNAKDFGADNDSSSTDAAELFSASDDYELLEEIGRGGQGVVYRARQKSLNRTVAIKIIGISNGRTKAHLKRFRLEAEAAARLNHPFVVPIHEIGQRKGRCYFSMGLVEGGRLDQIAKREPMSPRQATEVIAKLARTVHYAHQHGIIHRDIKPGNILLDTKGEPHLTDFGVARLLETENDATCTIEVSGTPSYMAPEQAHANNRHVSSATDVYGLGAVLYQLLAGQPPFTGGTPFETVRLLLETEPRQPRLLNPKVDRDLSTICLKCLEKDPKRRYSSALALAEDLEHWLRHEPIRARRTGVLARGRKWIRRSPAAAALVVMSVLLASAVGVIVWKVGAVGRQPSTGIAVLPFENLSNDREDAYFAEGMQDEILARLSKIADLKVISRTSTQKYKSAPDNLREIAKQLGVGNVLEGSVQKSGDAVRVNVQLINALNDAHLWGDVYERKLTDIFAVESDIATTIADTLQAKLTGAEKQLIAAQPTTDLTAYELYLKGRSLWGKRSGDNLPKAIAFYEQAIARDPNYALAYAGLAEAYVILPFYTATAPQDAHPKAKTAALKALQLDERLAEAHTALGLLLCIDDLDMAGSISEFQRAIALNPNYATAHLWYGNGPLLALGRFEEAIAEGKRAVELDPLSPPINAGLGQNLYIARRYDEAIAELRRTLEIDPTFYYAHYNLGIALQLKGDVPAAIAEYTKAQQLSDDLFVQMLLAAAKAQSGDKDAAIQMLAELEELSRHRYVSSDWRCVLYLSLGNREKAIRWLEQGIADHDGVHITWIKVDPLLDPLRGDPRFEALVQKVVGPKQK